MTFLDPNNPTPEELEMLRVECGKAANTYDSTAAATPSYFNDDSGSWQFTPPYSTSYDAILPEIQKLDEKTDFVRELYRLHNIVEEFQSFGKLDGLDSPEWAAVLICSVPHQLALAWLKTKQKGRE